MQEWDFCLFVFLNSGGKLEKETKFVMSNMTDTFYIVSEIQRNGIIMIHLTKP